MAFDIDGARKAGYSDAEIADHLAKSSGFDVAGARKAGYNDADLVSHLAKKQASKPQAAPGVIPSDPTQSGPPVVESPSILRRIRNLLGPTVEGLGAVGGGILGTPLAPGAGTVGGAALGYGIAKGGLRVIDELAGWQKPPESALQGMATGATDLLEGAAMEAGGQIVARNVVPAAARVFGAAKDAVGGMRSQVKAGKIARDALGPDLPAVRNALSQAPSGMTAAQATSEINSPTWQALAQQAGKHDPRFFGTGPLTPVQEAAAVNQLAGMAGGNTQTAAIVSRGTDKAALNALLGPTREIELAAANTAGRMKPALEGEAQRMAEAAASKVGDVRRFTEAEARAAMRAANTTTVPGMPQVPGRYTYMGELANKAEKVAQQSADASLPFGQAARFAQARADSLAAHGLRPLTPEGIEAGISRTLQEPSLAGNKDIETVMRSVGDEISKWTKSNGVIDAEALYAIRKNAVKTAVTRLGQGMEPAAQKALASDVSNRLAPLIDDAIERAGGTGWKQYLADYAAGRQLIDQKKLGAEALSLLKNSPRDFVRLVEGNNPDAVNKVFSGAKNGFDLSAQMSPANMNALQSTADLTRRGIQAADQAAAGQTAFRDVMQKDSSTFQLPNPLDPKIALTNKVLRYVQGKFSVNAMQTLTEGMRSGKSALEMLSVLPAKERVELLKAMQKPELWMVPGAPAAAVNSLSLVGQE
jgi:hypothetical protein